MNKVDRSVSLIGLIIRGVNCIQNGQNDNDGRSGKDLSLLENGEKLAFETEDFDCCGNGLKWPVETTK